MPSRVEVVQELKALFKQAFIPVPPYETGAPQGPPQGDPNAQAAPTGLPAGAPEATPPAPQEPTPPEQGPPQAPGATPLPPEVASIIDQVVNAQQSTSQRLKDLEAKFEQDKLLRDKDREAGEKRRQLIETVLPVASTV